MSTPPVDTKPKRTEEIITELKKEAYELKAVADEDLKQSNYEHAITSYTDAIRKVKTLRGEYKLDQDSLNVLINEIVVPSNLNMSYIDIKLTNWSDAINHCSKVLFADKENTKALYRRCLAYINKENFEEAEKDLKDLQQKLPNSTELKLLVQNFEKKRKEVFTREGKKYKKMFNGLREINKSIEYENKSYIGKKIDDVYQYISLKLKNVKDCICCRRKGHTNINKKLS